MSLSEKQFVRYDTRVTVLKVITFVLYNKNRYFKNLYTDV